LVFKLCWESGKLPGVKARMRMLDSDDHLILTAKRRKKWGEHKYGIFMPDACRSSAVLEVQAKGQQFTLKVPMVDPNAVIEREIVGIAKDRTHDGLGSPFFHLLLNYADAPYVAVTKADRMGALAIGAATPERYYRFRSKVPEFGPDRKPQRLIEIPEIAENSSKNVVFVDQAGVVVLKMYKMADQIVSLYAVPFIGPLIAFAVAIAVIH
jgi:hypothetical protein